MRREFSAGGVVVRRMRGRWWFAATRPQGRADGVWTLPKGLVDTGETVRDAALREVLEETGITATIVEKLGDSRYVYTWEGERVFKIVSFFLMRRLGGQIGAISPEMRVEVAETRWLPLDEAPRLLTHAGERALAARAAELLATGVSSRSSSR
ncbi:MAG: NUDIX domain-containing protein [Gaiellales bacterium]